MKLKDFNDLFLKTFTTTLVTNKKPSVLFRNYMVASRLGRYYCIDFVQFFSLLRRVVFFLQGLAANNARPTLFFENPLLYPLYKEAGKSSNMSISYTPYSIKWSGSWEPQTIDVSLSPVAGLNYLDYTNTVAGVGIFCEVLSLFVPNRLVAKSWPLVLCLPLRDDVGNKMADLTLHGLYLIPAQQPTSLASQCFLVSFFCKVVSAERRRSWR